MSVSGLRLGISCLVIALAFVTVGIAQENSANARSWTVSRIAGEDRYDTAVKLSSDHYPGGASIVVIASGEGFADSLSGSSLAAKLKAPILFVKKSTLPESTRQELLRLKPFQVLILGGSAVVSPKVESEIESLNIPDVRRLAGEDRYETAAKILKWGWPQPISRVFVVSGETYLPGLLASAVAGRTGSPVVPVRKSQVPPVISAELQRLEPEEVVELGYGQSQDALGGEVYSDVLSVTGTSITGFRHTDFAVAVENLLLSEGEKSVGASKALLVTGEEFADSLSAGAVAGAFGYPLLFTNRLCMPRPISNSLTSLGVMNLVVVGGPNAVSVKSSEGTICTTSSGTPQSSTTTTTAAPPTTFTPSPIPTLPSGTFLLDIGGRSHICEDSWSGWAKYDCVRYYNQNYVSFISPDYYCSGSQAIPTCSTFWYPSDLATYELPTSVFLDGWTSIGPFLCKRATFGGYSFNDYDCIRYSGGNPALQSFFNAYKCTRETSFECRTDFYPSEMEGIEIRMIGWNKYACERTFWGYECFRYWGFGSPRDAIGFFPDYYCNTWWECRTDRMP